MMSAKPSRLFFVIALADAALFARTAGAAEARWSGGAGCISADYTELANGWQYVGGATSPLYSDTAKQTYVKFMGADQDYAVTLDADMKVFIVQQQQKNQTLRLQFSPHVFETVNGEGWQLSGANSTVRLESGTLKGYVYTKQPSTLVVDGPDSAIIGGVNVRDSDGATVVITNGAKVTGYVDIHGLSNNRVFVVGEGTLVDVNAQQLNVGGWNSVQQKVIDGTAVVTNNYYLIGAGAVVSNVTKGARCGFYGSFSTLDIDDGKLFADELYVGVTKYASNNVVRLAHEGRAILNSTKYIQVARADNNDPASCGNTLLYEDYVGSRALDYGFRIGGVADWVADRGKGASNNTVRIVRSTLDLAPSQCYFYTMGGANNGVVVSDGSHVRLSATDDGQPGSGMSIGIGYQNASHGNYLVVEGAGTTLSNFNSNVGTVIGYRNARGCRLDVRDGGAFYASHGVSCGTSTADGCLAGGGHLVRVSSNGRFEIPSNALNLGHTLANGGVASNAVEVVDGGTMEVYRLRLYGWDNSVLVSNATLHVTEEFYPTYGQTTGGSNTVITLAGESPRFLISGKYNYFYNGTKVRFVIPTGGYRTVPFERTFDQANIQFLTDDTDFEFVFDEAAMRRTGARTVLMKTTVGFVMSDAQLARLRRNLPAGCKLYFSKDAENLTLSPDADRRNCPLLVLKVSHQGMSVFIR